MSNKAPKAPRPGVGKRVEEAKAASQVLEFGVRGEVRRLAPGVIPMKDRAVIRRELEGASVESYLMLLDARDIGVDTFFVMWFLAGRQSDPTLSFAADEAAFNEMTVGITADDLVFRVVDPSVDSPEA